MEKSSFRKNLRNELDFQNLTVKELAAMTGIPKTTIDCYLGVRETMPPADIATKIANALKVSVEYLVTGKNDLVEEETSDFSKYKPILQDLKKLDDLSVSNIKVMIHALAENPNFSRSYLN